MGGEGWVARVRANAYAPYFARSRTSHSQSVARKLKLLGPRSGGRRRMVSPAGIWRRATQAAGALPLR